jgi:23S rRNA pseudouridine2604 synthase
MSDRSPLGLSADQRRLRAQRAQALERLSHPTPQPPQNEPRSGTGVEGAPRQAPRQARPESRPSPAAPARASDAPRERFDSPVRDHKGARPIAALPRVALPAARPAMAEKVRPISSDARAGAPRRIQAPAGAGDGTRLNKRMAELQLCSRREGDAWIEQGWVTVNGVVAQMGQLVQPGDRIDISEQARGQQEQQVTILLHKPMGFVSGQAEDGHQPAVTLINSQSRWQHCTSPTRFNFSQLQGLAPAGRLDIDSVGLLVLTQDGRVARQLIGEDAEMEKEYLVRVTCTAADGRDIAVNVQAAFPADQLALLRQGLSLDGEPLKPAQVDWQNPEQLRFVLTQGKKRQIRRMCEQVGLKVVGLKRIRMGNVALGNLPAGQWRYLLPGERF